MKNRRVDTPVFSSGRCQRKAIAGTAAMRLRARCNDDGVRPSLHSKSRPHPKTASARRAGDSAILIESIVSAILVVITHLVTHQPTEVLFVQRNDVVEDLAAATTHPAFRNPVLPRRPD